jgi:hypothetical protein
VFLLLPRWAGGLEDKYFARLAKGAIKIYETPEMTQLDKKDLKLEGVQVRNILARKPLAIGNCVVMVSSAAVAMPASFLVSSQPGMCRQQT